MSSTVSTPIDNPIIINLMPSWGCTIVGAFLGQSFWAISTLQTFIYYKNYERDRPSLKLLVFILWLLDTANQILVVKTIFILVVNYGSIVALEAAPIEALCTMLISAAVIFVVQIYYVHRIYHFAGKKIWIMVLTIIWVALAIWQVVSSVVFFSLSVGKPYTVEIRPLYANLNMSGRLAAVLVDSTLSVCMVWVLIYKYKTPVPKTRQILYRVMVVTINSGAWTAIFALLLLILARAFPKDFYYVIFVYPMCSLYLNSFMGNLNARSYIRGDRTVHFTSDLPNPTAPITTLEFQQGISDTSESHHMVSDLDKENEVV